jgi:hypothetical protein
MFVPDALLCGDKQNQLDAPRRRLYCQHSSFYTSYVAVIVIVIVIVHDKAIVARTGAPPAPDC